MSNIYYAGGRATSAWAMPRGRPSQDACKMWRYGAKTQLMCVCNYVGTSDLKVIEQRTCYQKATRHTRPTKHERFHVSMICVIPTHCGVRELRIWDKNKKFRWIPPRVITFTLRSNNSKICRWSLILSFLPTPHRN